MINFWSLWASDMSISENYTSDSSDSETKRLIRLRLDEISQESSWKKQKVQKKFLPDFTEHEYKMFKKSIGVLQKIQPEFLRDTLYAPDNERYKKYITDAQNGNIASQFMVGALYTQGAINPPTALNSQAIWDFQKNQALAWFYKILMNDSAPETEKVNALCCMGQLYLQYYGDEYRSIGEKFMKLAAQQGNHDAKVYMQEIIEDY